jgi:hypothetical protein
VTTFAEEIDATPIYAMTENGRGFFAPLMRAYGHILYLAGRQAESSTRRPTDNDVQEEFNCALEHLRAISDTTMTQATKDTLTIAVNAVALATVEFNEWSAIERETNFVKLANYLLSKVGLAVDREFLGLRDSDIGSSL